MNSTSQVQDPYPNHSAQVQGEAQGEDNSLDKFLERLRQGPSGAQVSDVNVSEISEKGDETDFVQK